MTNIYRMRKRAGVLQHELAAQIGVTQSTVSQWESGRTAPRVKNIVEIAAALGCTVDELLRDGGEEGGADDGQKQ